jgi:hypothetical protein
MACDAGMYPASPTPTRARQAKSCQNRFTRPPAAVARLHSITPTVMTPRRERRSPMTPSGRAMIESTMMYAEPIQPSCASVSWSSCLIGSNSAKTTLRSV